MDSKGSLVDTNLKIFPSDNLLQYLKTITIDDNVPNNIIKIVKGANYKGKHIISKTDSIPFSVQFTDDDIVNLNKIIDIVNKTEDHEKVSDEISEIGDKNPLRNENKDDDPDQTKYVEAHEEISKTENKTSSTNKTEKADPKTALNEDEDEKVAALCLTTTDIDWLYAHLQNKRNKGVDDVPYLHTLLEGANIEMPDNIVIKRNPVLEARCVKLRAQQEAREYRKMTKTVDNVRMRFPEDSISYQLKQLNRHLIAIGQFIISIFAGFLFGFKGVEWMIGHLDFGFRLLLGVMCALIIALAEIYFLAKKLNEELNIPETVQLGGPPKFANPPKSYDYIPKEQPKQVPTESIDKEHQD